MIPLRDTIPSRRAPVVTVALIAVNLLVFLHETALGPYLPEFVHAYGLVPGRLVHWTELGGNPLDPARFLPLFTSMFWHGGWLHLIGNMLYLWIFGDNVEDRLGHVRYLLLYLAGGVAAALAQVAISPDSAIPMVGASGAIAAVLGGYIVLYPRASVYTWIFFSIVPIPAVVWLGLWFVLQLFSGVASLGAAATGGVAFFAHVGGFVAGLALVKLLDRGPPRFAPPPDLRLRRWY